MLLPAQQYFSPDSEGAGALCSAHLRERLIAVNTLQGNTPASGSEHKFMDALGAPGGVEVRALLGGWAASKRRDELLRGMVGA